jgi:predicted nucleic acid-binding protein
MGLRNRKTNRPRVISQTRPIQRTLIDACCLIDLLASGEMEAILRASGHVWYLPEAVRAEVQFVRQDNSAQPGAFVNVRVDLTPHIDSGLLRLCQPDTSDENTLFVRYANLFRSDGEAMCVALAESRGWLIATDDRKAIRVAQQAGLTVLSCPELIKTWADATRPDSALLVRVLSDIQRLARFTPTATMPESAWWFKQLSLR